MPETTLMTGNIRGRVAVDATQVSGEGGPQYPRLIVPIKLKLTPPTFQGEDSQYILILNAKAQLKIADHPSRIADGTGMDEPRKHSCDQECVIRFEIPLDPYRIRWIESLRRRDLKVRIGLEFSFGIYQTILVQKDKQTLPKDYLATFERSWVELDVEIPQSHWVDKVLPGLGNLNYFIIEIPTGKKILEDAWKYLEQAEAAFNHWDSKGAYASCREAGTLLENVIKARTAGKGFAYSEKWQRALTLFSHWASVGLHLEDFRKSNQYKPEDVVVTKADTEILLMMTRVLIKYAEEMLTAAE